MLVLQEVIGPLYAEIIARAAKLLPFDESYLDLWPTQPTLSEPWSMLEESIFTSLADLPVLYTAAAKGQWLKPRDAIFATEADARLILIFV